MTREEAKKYLEELNSKIHEYGLSSISQYDAKYNFALKLAIESLENCDRELPTEAKERMEKEYQEKLEKEREEMVKEIQRNCDHDWGPREWIYYTYYKCKCRTRGKVEEFYERD